LQAHLRAQVDWPQPFPAEEYAERRARVRRMLAEAGLDAIYVTAPANITWLTGYDMVWYHLQNLTGVLVRAEAEEAVFFDSVAHTTIVSTTPEIGEVVWLDSEAVSGTAGECIEAIVAEVRRRGLGGARIGLEMWGSSPHASVMESLAAALRAGGVRVEDHWALLDELRLVKSPREVAHMRKAAEIGDAAMTAARDVIRPGLTETALEGVIIGAMMAAGGGYPGIRTMVASGPRSGTHHSPPTRREMRQGDLVFIDFCGCYDRYHVNINRTFSLGAPDPRWTALMDKAAGCVDTVIAQARLGEPLSTIDTIAQRYIDEAGLRQFVWWVGGYALGIGIPPDWCSNHWLRPRHDITDRMLEPGMVFNLENQFDVWENWPGGSGAAYIETLLATEDGLEVLSKHPRTLVVV
jgi:Xaa-Pro aminopeptidase